jgi:hypothetical protein
MKCGVPQGSILGPLFFQFYISDLPEILNEDNSMVLYAHDTSIIITDTDKLNFEINLKHTFRHINMWFNDNSLTLNFQKIQYLEFWCMNYCNSTTQIVYDEKSITNATETNSLGLIIHDTLSWKQHTKQVVNKLSSACYVLRNIKYIVSLETVRLFYFAHVHSIMSYGIIL